jgi:hypothetical protein
MRHCDGWRDFMQLDGCLTDHFDVADDAILEERMRLERVDVACLRGVGRCSFYRVEDMLSVIGDAFGMRAHTGTAC